MVRCYVIVLEFGAAAGAAGGIITSGVLTVSIMAGIFLSLYDHIKNIEEEDEEKFKKCFRWAKYAQYILVGVFIAVSLLSFGIIVALSYSVGRVPVFNLLQGICLAIAITFGLAFP